MRSISAWCFLSCLLCTTFLSPCMMQSVLPPQSCNSTNLVAENALLTDDIIPKLRFLQRILDQNFTIPDAPSVQVHHNATQNSVTISVSNFASFTQTFHVSYYVDVGNAALSNPTNVIVNAIKDDNWTFRGSTILSASNNFVPRTRYLFSAVARVNSLNLQSSPSALFQFDYLPSFNVVDTIAAISVDSTPLSLDIVTRYFKSSTFITLFMRDLSININVTFSQAPNLDRIPSNVFIARVRIPELSLGGPYQLIFNDPLDRITITRSLEVRPPFRPAFRSVFPSSVPLIGATVRILLTNVTEPLLAASTFFSFQSSPSVSFSVADSIEASATGPLDMFITFRMPNVSFAGTVTVLVRPNNNSKADLSFSVVYSAVRLLSSIPISYFFPRIGIIRVTIAVDVGIPTVSSVSFTGAAASRHSMMSSRMLSEGVYEYTIQLQASIDVGSYQGTLSISANSQNSDIRFPIAVVSPPTPTIAFDPATIFDDGSSASRVSITVQNIGDISSSSDLIVNCSVAFVCVCSVESFSFSFASINCILLGPPGAIRVTVINTNIIGFGISIFGSVTVLPSTTPRVLAASTDMLSQLGRFPVAVTVTNFRSIDRIRINGVQYNSNSNFFLALPVVRPITSDEESLQEQRVVALYPQERIFVDTLFFVRTQLQSLSNNATIVLFRMPKVTNSSIVVEIEQLSPIASAVANFVGVSLSISPSVTVSVPRINMQGGTSVLVNLRQYIPITQESDISIVCSIFSNSTMVPVVSTLVRTTTTDSVFQFLSPTLNNTVDFNCQIISRIDSILGVTAPSASFSLSVFDPRSLTLVDSSQRRFYSSGGPRIISVNVRFFKGFTVSARVNVVQCVIVSAPSLDDSRLNPDAIQNIRIMIPDFPSLVGDFNLEIQSGSEMLAVIISLVSSPISPVLSSIQGNTAIPSGMNTALVTATFQEFIASSNTSSFMVFVPFLANFSVPALNVSSDFQRTIVSFSAPQLINMGESQSSVSLDAFVADLSSACNRMLTCVGRFRLQYSNVDLASFASMTPMSGSPSVSTRVTVLLTNVQTTNVSLVSVSVGDPHKSNVATRVTGSSFGGKGISSETAITFLISWIANTRPLNAVNIALTLVLDKQTVIIPTTFTVLSDNQPQLLSVSPNSISIFGGSHFASFIQPAAFGFRSVSVFVGGAAVASNFSTSGDLISFSSPRIQDVRMSSVSFVLVGSSLTVTLTNPLAYTAPPPVTVRSVFPSHLSSFGSSLQVQLVDVPSFWSSASVRTNLVQGASSTSCIVLEFTRSSAGVMISLSCPALNPGFSNLEFFDASTVSFAARSLPLSVANPTAPQFVSILPSQFFSSQLSLIALNVRNFPVGLSARISFSRPSPLLDIPTNILSSFFEPSNTSTTLATFNVLAPSSVNVFAVIISVTASNGMTISCTSPFFSVIDDSIGAVVSVKPSSLQSIGGSVEVSVLGFPPSLFPSNFSATFTIENSLRIAAVSSCSYNSDGSAVVVVLFPFLDIVSSATVTVSLIPRNFDSKSVTFQVNIQKLQSSLSSVIPSVISDSGGDRLTVRLLNFPVTTFASFLSASIGGVSASLSVFLVSSRPDITIVELQTPFLNLSASGTRELIISYILSPSVSLTAPVVIQVTSRAILVPSVAPVRINFNASAIIPITVAFSAVDFRKFNDFPVGSSFNSASTSLSGESLCFSIILASDQGAPRCSDIGCLVQESTRTNYRIMSKNVPYQGCISFGVQYVANAAPVASVFSPRIQNFSVFWNAQCNTQVQVGIASVGIVGRILTISPSTGAVSGGYVIIVSVSGFSSFDKVSVFFGNTMAAIRSQTILGSSLLLSVICPASTTASTIDVSFRSGNSIIASSTFNYILGCLDYGAFCSSLQGNYIANIRSIASDPPSAAECSISYCIVASSISAPVLVSFPGKQSTSVSTIAFFVRNLFVLSGSQIRVNLGNDNILLPIISSVFTSASDIFSVTVESPALYESSVLTIWVYSAITGRNLNASFELTFLAPIVGPINIVDVLPSAIPFEGISSVRLLLSNFPYNVSFPIVTFFIVTRFENVNRNFTVQSSSFHEFGNGSVVLPLQPSSIISLSQSRQMASLSLNVTVTVRTANFNVNSSVFFTVRVVQRVNRRISSIFAFNALSSSRFRSIAGTLISISVQGFDGPDVTTCFGFKSSSPNRNHQSCGIAQEQNCFISRNAIFYGDEVSTLSIAYPRDFFSTLPSSATVAELTVRILDEANLDACNFVLNSRIIECGTAPNENCMQIVPASSPSLQSEPPSSVSFITIQNSGVITGSEIFLTFSNFFDSTDSVTARIGSDSGPNAFPRIQGSCTFISCRISVVVGGNINDALLVDSTDGLTISVRARNVTLPVRIPRIVAPAPIVVPSFVFSSGGSIVTVTSYSFSQLPSDALYTVSDSAFSIVRASKIGNFTTLFELRLMTPLQVGSRSVSILSSTSKITKESLTLEIFPAITLNNPLVSGCFAGDRQVQIVVSNLPMSLENMNLLVSFNNRFRPAVLISSATLNFSFPCDENVASQAPLTISAVVSGFIVQASTLIIIPSLPLSLTLLVGSTRFAINISQMAVQASVLCSSNAAARSNSRCRTAIVNTELRPGTNSFLDIVPVGSSISVLSMNMFVISASPGNSLITFVFDPAVDVTPVGLYNLVLTANSRSTSILVSVFDPVVSAICVAPSSCSLNSNVGGVVTIMLINFFTFSSGSTLGGDLILSISKLDGTPMSSLRPQLTAFSSTENRLSVQLNRYTAASDFTNGQMAVLLNVALRSSPSTNVNIRILLRLDPQIISVDFTESLTSLIISMNQPVIFRFSATNCSSLFTNETIVRLGRNSVCSFSSDSAVAVRLGSDSSVAPGDLLSILPGNVIPSDGFPISNFASSPSVSALPSTFRKPFVEIKGTQFVEGCTQANSASITAVANSPRPFASATWSCPACSNDASSLTGFLSTAQGLSVAIPANIISSSKCRMNAPCGIIVTVVDFVGRSSVSAPFFIYANQNAVPDIQFAPLDFLRYTPDMSILLRTRFRFSTCFGDTASVPVFAWNILPSPVLNVTSSSPRLLLPPNSLLPGVYQVTVTVLLDGATVSAVQPLVISQRALIASLSAPNIVSFRSNITFDASRSRDLDAARRTLLFSWSCIYENGPCLDSSGNRLLLPQRSGNHSILSFPASTLQLPSTIAESLGSKFFFRVEVSNSGDQRVASSAAEVVVVLDDIPTVVVNASSTVSNAGSNIPISLSAAAPPLNTNVNFVWTEISGLIPGGMNSVLDPAFKITDPTIVINSALLVPGRPYVFQAAVANNVRAAGTVSISVNPGPSSGRCFIRSVQNGAVTTASCRPPNQCSIMSRVTVSCENWMDDNLPLKYQIGYRSDSGTEITETRLDYRSDATSAIQMPIGIQNLFVDICDSFSACTTFSSFSENPVIISQVVLSAEQQNSIARDVTQSIQSGDVDAFSSALAISISFLRSTRPSVRRLLQSVVTLQTAPALISDMALKTVDIGASITLSQTLSSLVQASRDFDAASASSVIRSIVTLSALFSPASSDESLVRTSQTHIDTAAKATADVLNSLSNVNVITAGTNFQNMKLAETNLARALLQNAQLNQVIGVSSADKQYAIRATSVRSNAAVAIAAPFPLGSAADFGFSLNVLDGSSVRVLSSFTSRTKYASSVPQGNVLMSDVADCTVVKQQGVNSAFIKSGSELGTVNIRIPFNFTSSGPGSHAVVSQDLASVRIAFYDETVLPPVWKYDGCQGTVQVINTVSAVFLGTCSHLTTFGIIAAPPTTQPGQTLPPGRPQPQPIPGNNPAVTAAPPSPSSTEEFPLWAIIFIPVAGGVALLSVGGFFTYRRVTAFRTRAKQIVAASAWKSFASVTTLPKPTASLAISSNHGNGPDTTSANPVKVPEGMPVNSVKGPDVGSLVALSKKADVLLPVTHATPSVASKLSTTSSSANRRQELANIAAAVDDVWDAADDAVAAEVENNVRLPESSPVMASQLRAAAARSKLFSSVSPQRRDPGSSGTSSLHSSVLSVLQRRQQRLDLNSQQSAPAPYMQTSPTGVPQRLPSAAALTESAFLRSSSHSQGGLSSPFFAQQGPETNQVSPRSFQSLANRARSPLPSTQSRSRSAIRATSPLASGQFTASLSASPGKFGVASYERPLSPPMSSFRSNVSPTNSSAGMLSSSAATRGTSRPGFRAPGISPQQGLGARYDQA